MFSLKLVDGLFLSLGLVGLGLVHWSSVVSRDELVEGDELAHFVLFLVSGPNWGVLDHQLFVQTKGTELFFRVIISQMDHELASSVKILTAKVTEELLFVRNLDLAELVRIFVQAVWVSLMALQLLFCQIDWARRAVHRASTTKAGVL